MRDPQVGDKTSVAGEEFAVDMIIGGEAVWKCLTPWRDEFFVDDQQLSVLRAELTEAQQRWLCRFYFDGSYNSKIDVEKLIKRGLVKRDRHGGLSDTKLGKAWAQFYHSKVKWSTL